MSAGSTNIVVQVTDQVDSTIAPKIREIASAAREANGYLVVLQGAVAGLSGGSGKLGDALRQVKQPLDEVTGGTGRLQGALAQLAGRVAGAEAGFGMLGGALARVGVAAGVAGPLIIAALAIAAIVGAILIYDKFEAGARKLMDTQIALAEQFGRNRDKLLEQQETLIGLTQGPMAKFQAQLTDLSKKEITVGIANITKELEDQKSKWDSLVAVAERFLNINDEALSGEKSPKSGSAFGIQQAQDFIKQQELTRTRSSDQVKALQTDLEQVGQKLIDLHNLESTLEGKNLEITEKSRQGIQDYNKELFDDYQLYLAKKRTLEIEAAGQTQAEQRKLSEQQLRQFNEDLSKLKRGDGVVTPQDTLQLRQGQLSQFDAQHPGDTNQDSPFAATRDTLVKDIGNATQAIDRQNRSLQELITKYRDEISASGAYSVALRTEVEQRKVAAEVDKLAPGNTNNAAVIQILNSLISAKEHDIALGKEEIAIYDKFQGPIEKYNAALAASSFLKAQGAISANQAAIAEGAATRAKESALNPLNEYSIGLQHQVALFGTYGTALTVATEVDKIRQGLQKEGRDLTTSEVGSLTNFLTQLERQKLIQQEINQLYIQNAEVVNRATTQRLALDAALSKGIISETQYQIATAKLNVELANQALLESKNVTLQNQIVAGIGKYIQGYQGLAKGISDAYGQAFTTIADGAASSLGRAIAYGQNLGDALTNVARQAVSELITAFVKLGIQWLVTQAIGDSIGTATVAANVAQGQAVAAAWAPAAAFVSLASFGANAAPASAAVGSTVALTEALSLISGHSSGGFISGPGSGTSDSILGRLSNGEFVVNARATADNRDLLESINSGASAVKANNASPTSSRGSMQVQVIHDGSTAIAVQQVNEGYIRVVAKQVAQETIATHASATVANDLQNPNSRVSKAITQNTMATRRR